MSARCMIIGLDGADWSVIDKLVSLGRLPNIQRLLEQGARADLNSYDPSYDLAIMVKHVDRMSSWNSWDL